MKKYFLLTAIFIYLFTPQKADAATSMSAQLLDYANPLENNTLSHKYQGLSIAEDSNGFKAMTYHVILDKNNRDKTKLMYVKCNNEDCSDKVQTRLDSSSDFLGQYSNLLFDSQDRPVISYLDFQNKNIKVIRCNDSSCQEGDYTINTIQLGDTNAFISMILDANDKPVLSYSSTDGLKVVRCNTKTCAKNDVVITPITMTQEAYGNIFEVPVDGFYNRLAKNANGKPVIVTSHSHNGEGVILVKCDNMTCVTRTETVLAGSIKIYDDTNYIPAGYDKNIYVDNLSVAVGTDNKPIVTLVADYTAPDSSIKYDTIYSVKCRKANCMGSEDKPNYIQQVSDLNASQQAAVKVMQDGTSKPVITFNHHGALIINKYKNTKASKVESTMTVAPAPVQIVDAEMILDGYDKPFIIFHDRYNTKGMVKYAYCAGGNCW